MVLSRGPSDLVEIITSVGRYPLRLAAERALREIDHRIVDETGCFGIAVGDGPAQAIRAAVDPLESSLDDLSVARLFRRLPVVLCRERHHQHRVLNAERYCAGDD